MDPITISLAVFAVLWFIRRAVEDGYAAVQGRTSPRIARRRAAYELAQEQAAATGAPTIGQAVAGRLAERIADRRPPGPMRRYLAGLWEDSWTDAQERREEKRSRRIQRTTSPKPKQRDVLVMGPCSGCGVQIVEPAEWCPDCERAQQDDQPDPTDDDLNDEDFDDETPEPTPAPDTTRKDPSPMTTPANINGDVTDPLATLAFATGCLDLNAAIMNELDVMANQLIGEGVGDEFIQIVRDAWGAGEQFGMASDGAREEYARHVATQADIASNTELRDTVAGTYLDASRS